MRFVVNVGVLVNGPPRLSGAQVNLMLAGPQQLRRVAVGSRLHARDRNMSRQNRTSLKMYGEVINYLISCSSPHHPSKYIVTAYFVPTFSAFPDPDHSRKYTFQSRKSGDRRSAAWL